VLYAAKETEWIRVTIGVDAAGQHLDHFFHNHGDGTFTDVSEKAGVSDSGYLCFSIPWTSNQ